MIRFFNTLGGAVEPFVPLEPGTVKLYTCGPTVYDYPHIGNWRAYVFEDLLKRALMLRGFKVVHVMNITDVDDKTIRDSRARTVEELNGYTQKYIDAFDAERGLLNVLPADVYPRATGHIPEMVALVKTLLDKGYAYRKDGSVYFAIDKFPSYGRLSRIDLQERRPGSRGDADEYEKESVHDFALWKAPKPGEPFWETAIGPGRPGWHIECSAMSAKYLGPGFDIHCGGVDNIFPHHENEIAQSEAANGTKFVNFWLHCHHLVVNGEKMAKSKGNSYRLRDLMDKGFDAREVRFLLLSTHYRKMLNLTDEAMHQARAGLERMRNFLVDLEDVDRDGGPGPETLRMVEGSREKFAAALDDDLNISEALAALFTFIKSANVLRAGGRLTQGDAAALRNLVLELDDKVLGLGLRSRAVAPVDAAGQAQAESAAKGKADVLDSRVRERIEERQKARAAKDFKRADEIRKELLDMGVLLEDTKDGVRWKKIAPPKV
jgi:cysteinyl-tRNA synthetase